jgi:hypothetical protein
MSFQSLALHEALMSAIEAAGYTEATEVQQQAIPLGLQGADLMVSSRTGSGKTAAFLLPILAQVQARREAEPERLPAFVPRFTPGGPRGQSGRRGPARGAQEPFHARALVLAPTRELAQQVAQAAMLLGKGIKFFTVATVVGGMPYPQQLQRLRAGADLIIATPGRLMDLAGTNPAMLSEIQTLVLDEADRMLDLGFIEDIEAIAAMLPKPRQTLMFSATFDGAVGGLARKLMNEPQRIEVSSSVEEKLQIEQRLHWADHPMHKPGPARAPADRRQRRPGRGVHQHPDRRRQMADQLAELGHAVAALHGGMPQGKRNRVLQGLRRRSCACSSPPMWRRAASTCRPSATSSTRPADEGRGLRAPHRPHRPRRPLRPGGDAGAARGPAAPASPAGLHQGGAGAEPCGRPGAEETVPTRARASPGVSATATRPSPGVNARATSPSPGASATAIRPSPGASATSARLRPGASAMSDPLRPGVSATNSASPGVSATTRARPSPGASPPASASPSVTAKPTPMPASRPSARVSVTSVAGRRPAACAAKAIRQRAAASAAAAKAEAARRHGTPERRGG